MVSSRWLCFFFRKFLVSLCPPIGWIFFHSSNTKALVAWISFSLTWLQSPRNVATISRKTSTCRLLQNRSKATPTFLAPQKEHCCWWVGFHHHLSSIVMWGKFSPSRGYGIPNKNNSKTKLDDYPSHFISLQKPPSHDWQHVIVFFSSPFIQKKQIKSVRRKYAEPSHHSTHPIPTKQRKAPNLPLVSDPQPLRNPTCIGNSHHRSHMRFVPEGETTIPATGLFSNKKWTPWRDRAHRVGWFLLEDLYI